MKLKNKKTGEIREARIEGEHLQLWAEALNDWVDYDDIDYLAKYWERYEEPKEDEYISQEVFMSEYANDDFWGRVPYLIGVNDGMVFAYKIIEKTIDSGTTPNPEVIKANIENALKQKNILEKELEGGEE